MRIPIEVVAAVLATATLIHAHFYTPLLFWPLTSLVLSAIALAAHSPLAISRRMTFLAHAQGHNILTAALAAAIPTVVFKQSLSSAMFYLFTLLFVVLLNFAVLTTERLGYRKDVATGIVMSFQLTTTIALLYVIRTLYATTLDPLALITGEYVLIGFGDVLTQLPMLALALIFPLAYGIKYLYAAVDEQFTESLGIKTRRLDYLFLASMSLAVSATVYTLGSLMPAVLLVLPGAIAARYSPKLTDQIPLAISIAVLASAVAHLLYTALPWLWPSAALGLVMLALLLAKRYK